MTTDLISVLEPETLNEKLTNAIELDDPSVELPDGSDMELSDDIKQNIRVENVAHTIAEHISEVCVNHPDIQSGEFSAGSGDSGRQSQVYLQPTDTVSKEELRILAKQIKELLKRIFPTDYLIGITHGNSIDEEGYPIETEQYYIFLVYRVKTHGSPSKPSGDKTELV